MTIGRPLKNSTFWLLASIPILAVCAYQVWPIMAASNEMLPAGVDTMGHLTKAYCLAIRWKNLHFGDWFPQWYMGATTIQYYPPLSIWVLSLLQLLTDNIFLTFKVFSFTCYLLGGILVAGLGKKLSCSVGGSIAAGAMYTTGFTVHSMWVQVTPGTTLAYPFYPVLLWCLIDLCERPNRRNWLNTWIVASVIVLSHAMHAYLLFFTAGVFMLVWCLRYPDWGNKILVMVEVAALSVMVSGFWSIPGVTQLENPGIPWSPPEMTTQRILTPWMLMSQNSAFPSSVLFVCALLGVAVWLLIWKRRMLESAALVTALVLTLAMAYGPRNPLYRLLPMGSSLSPVRFLNAAFLPASLATGFFVDGVLENLKKARPKLADGISFQLAAAIILVVVSFLVDHSPDLPRPTTFPEISTLVDAIPVNSRRMFGSGRVAEEMPMAEGESAFLPVQKGLAITPGWNIEGTVHIYTLHDQNTAYFEDFPEYVLRNWYLWNARSALIDQKYDRMIDLAQESGWTLDKRQGRYVLLTLRDGPSYFMHPNTSALVIGRSSFQAAGLFPWFTQGREPDPLKYDDSYVALFRSIVLYDLPPLDPQELEEWIIKWSKAGKTIIVDLSVTDSVPMLLGVRRMDVEVGGVASLAARDEGRSIYTEPIRLHLKSGRGAVYEGLDSVFLDIETPNGQRAICGSKQLQYGIVYFIGGHVPRLVEKGYREEARALWEPILSMSRPDTGIRPHSFEVESAEWTSRGVDIRCTSLEEQPMLISVTYTPRWRAYLDGRSIAIYKHENLMLVNLPPGRHNLVLRYTDTYVAHVGWLVTAITLLWVGFRAFVPAGARRAFVAKLLGGSTL